MATTQTEVQLVLSAKDEATSTLKKVGGSLQGLMKVGKVVAAGLAVAGGAVAAFGVKSIKAFAESEKEMAKFNATLATMGPKGQEARKSLLAAADAAVKLGFDDEEAANSLAKLFQRTGDVNEAMRLNAVAMDIARGKGIELSDANRIVNMALSGNVKELKLLGIEVDENATGLENLTAIQEKYSGQSQAFAQTTAGKLEILSKSWGNVEESIGQALVEGLQINVWLDKLSSWISSEKGQGAIKSFGNAVTTMVKAVSSAIKGLTSIFEAVFYGIFRGTDMAIEAWDDFKKSIKGIADSIIGFFKPVIDFINKMISGYNKLADKVGKKTLPEIRYKEMGGGVNPGGTYVVGEKRPEVFVPHQQGNIRQMSDVGMGGGVEVNFYNPVVRSEQDLESIIRAVKDSIARQQNFERFGIRTI